jgi:outer membrane protein OmpA-like peptidoglycan-associated protein
MRLACGRSALTGVLSLSIAACCHVPPKSVDVSGCQDISGIVGREFRFSFAGLFRAPTTEASAGLIAGMTFPQISREYRETLIMGDHLCRAAAAGRISPDIYERFLSAQLDGLGVLAVKSGARTPQEAQDARAAAAGRIAAAATGGLEGKMEAATLTVPGPPSSTPFGGAKAIYDAASPSLPDVPRDPNLDVDYVEMSVRIADLRREISLLKTPPGSVISTPGYQAAGYVLFENNSSDLTDQALATLKAVVAQRGPFGAYRVEGFSDATGAFGHNLALSGQRAARVAEALRALGVKGVISAAGGGRTNGFGAEAGLNRRVEITWLPPPGSP